MRRLSERFQWKYKSQVLVNVDIVQEEGGDVLFKVLQEVVQFVQEVFIQLGDGSVVDYFFYWNNEYNQQISR